MTTTKRTWKFWVSRTLLLALLIGAVWLTNLIWFKPFSIGQFYDREFIKLALRSPEIVTQLGIPVMYDFTKDADGEVTTEIERYIVMPGQACAYKVGMMKILALRQKAKQALGPKFDLKQFHRVVLMNGAVPLSVLEENIDVYIQEKKA